MLFKRKDKDSKQEAIVKYNSEAYKPAINYNPEQLKLIYNKFAPGTTKEEFELFLYMSKKYGLDILTKEIWCIKYPGYPAQIYAGRDGFLAIAHWQMTPDGKKAFDGMNTVIEEVDRPFEVQYYDKKTGKWNTFKADTQFVATTTVKRKDVSEPFTVTVWEEEYSTGRDLWKTKRRTMIQKVAESQALRRAFSISGIYSPEEMGQWEEEVKTKTLDKPKQKAEKIESKKITPETIKPEVIDTIEVTEETEIQEHDEISEQEEEAVIPDREVVDKRETIKYRPTFKSNKEYFATYDWSKVNLNEKPPSRGYDKLKKKPKPALETLKIWFYVLEYMNEEQAQEFMKNVTGKDKSWEYTYGDIKNIVTALEGLAEEELDDEDNKKIEEEFNYEQDKFQA